MNKQEFLSRLKSGLRALPENEVEERLTFYGEMIDDRIEDGLSQEDAVSQVGDVEDIISQIIADTPLSTLVKERARTSRKIKGWEIALLIIGSPVWLPILIAMLAVLFSLYITAWSVSLSLWAAEASIVFGAVSGVVAAVIVAFGGNGLSSVAMLGAGLVCAGLSVFMFYGCMAVTRGLCFLTKRSIIWFKSICIGKEDEK
jgi:uncharacterized membrane protein